MIAPTSAGNVLCAQSKERTGMQKIALVSIARVPVHMCQPLPLIVVTVDICTYKMFGYSPVQLLFLYSHSCYGLPILYMAFSKATHCLLVLLRTDCESLYPSQGKKL